jgi:hypothetical protein
MSEATIKNKFGTMAGWNNVTTNMRGRDIEGITEVDYSDEVERDNAYGQGAYPIGDSEGNVKPKASLTLYLEEIIALQRSLPPGTNISKVAPFDITVEYEYQGFKYKDRIRNCRFKGNGRAIKQGDKTISQKFDLLVSHVDWNII